MTGHRAVNTFQSADTTFPQSSLRGLSATVRILTGLLVLGSLAAGLYLAPTLAAYGLALLGLGVPLLLLLWLRPEFGLLAIIFLTSSFVPSNVVDLRLPIGGGLDLRDLALLGMLGLLFFRGLTRKSLRIPWWPVGASLLLFLGFAILSSLYALLVRNVESNWALGELRNVMYYAVFYAAAWSITSRHQLLTVLVGLFLIGDLVAGTLLLQQFLGANNPLLASMSGTHWHLWPQAAGSGGLGTLRIVPPGHVLIYVMMIVAFCLMVSVPEKGPRRAVLVLQFLFLNIALLLTYTRAQWMAAAIAIGVIVVVLFPTYRAQLARFLILGLATLLVALPVVGLLWASLENASLVNVVTERATSNTMQWRLFESEEALRSISENPVLGVGLGNSYRHLTLMAGEASGWWAGSLAAGEISRFTRYIHNSFLAIATKMGLPALIAFLWFCAVALVSSWQLYRELEDRQIKGLVLAVLAAFLGLLAWSTLHSHLVETESTSVVGLVIGLLASVHHMQKNQPETFSLQPSTQTFKSELSN